MKRDGRTTHEPWRRMYAAWSTEHRAGVAEEMPNCEGASKYGDAGPECCNGSNLAPEAFAPTRIPSTITTASNSIFGSDLRE